MPCIGRSGVGSGADVDVFRSHSEAPYVKQVIYRIFRFVFIYDVSPGEDGWGLKARDAPSGPRAASAPRRRPSSGAGSWPSRRAAGW